jgi:hypothetical protein
VVIPQPGFDLGWSFAASCGFLRLPQMQAVYASDLFMVILKSTTQFNHPDGHS